MNWGYYAERAAIELAKWRFRPKGERGAVLATAAPDLSRYRGVFFFLDYPALIHCGDQLFFLPLIRRLRQAGIATHVQPTPPLRFLFAAYPGLPAAPADHLVVSQADLLPAIRRRFGPHQPCFLIDTKAMSIDAPVSNFIVRAFNRFFSTALDDRITGADYLDFPMPRHDRFGLADKGDLVIFNNYVGSGRFRIPRGHDRIFREHLAREDGFVIHLGAEADSRNNRRDYRGLVDLDLRGQTTIEDLYAMLALDNVRRVYCHDTAVLHIANSLDRPIRLLFRRFFRPGENAQKRRAFSSLYERDMGHIVHLDAPGATGPQCPPDKPSDAIS